MLKIILSILIVVTIAYILLCIFMFLKQGNLLFFPAQAEDIHYKELQRDTTLQNINIQTKDGHTLDGWRQINPNEQYTLLYF